MANNVAVIGGGASGLTAAIAAARKGAKVTLYEGGARVGKKILITGNGRCNLTNINADVNHYHGENTKFIMGVKNRFWVNETIDFFKEIGVMVKEETEGRIYPNSDRASSVLDALRFYADYMGVRTVCDFEVIAVKKKDGKFLITSRDNKSGKADKVIVATGGMAAPSTGSKGIGYDIFKSMGHTVTPLRPSLVQLKSDTKLVRPLKGVRVNAAVTLGKYTEMGEVQFTDYGLSGIVIFNISARLDGEKKISLDLMPARSRKEINALLRERKDNLFYLTLDEFLSGMFNKKIGVLLLKTIGAELLTRGTDTLTSKEINRVTEIIKKWEFPVTGTMSWNNAQVTGGGVRTSEFNPSTMESKKTEGLYGCGEVMDIDGDCGGYNLQWAWSSGYTAGDSAAK